MRRSLALLAVAATAALTALVLGEYVLYLGTAVAAGLVVGFVLAEIMLAVGGWRGWVPAVTTAALGGGSITLAAWIEAGRGVAPIRSTAWAGVGLAAIVAAGRLRPTSGHEE